MRAFIDKSIQLVLCCNRAEQAAKQRRRSTDGIGITNVHTWAPVSSQSCCWKKDIR